MIRLARDAHKYGLLAKARRLKASHGENSVTAENAWNAESAYRSFGVSACPKQPERRER
jgi:hypothetical protein